MAAFTMLPAPAASAAQRCGHACMKARCTSKACKKRTCVSSTCKRRVARKQWREHRRDYTRPYRGWLYRTAQCESGGRWHINTGNGFYGGLQFTLSSWHAVGGVGYPHQASRLEQRYRGVRLLRAGGPGNWPVCGH